MQDKLSVATFPPSQYWHFRVVGLKKSILVSQYSQVVASFTVPVHYLQVLVFLSKNSFLPTRSQGLHVLKSKLTVP